jgi:hypothetical protein
MDAKVTNMVTPDNATDPEVDDRTSVDFIFDPEPSELKINGTRMPKLDKNHDEKTLIKLKLACSIIANDPITFVNVQYEVK